ncbi:acyl-CoA dehydrogenase family protein [Streptomonospora salina]|uniref:Alkylation response protein AidB-like acyl-CoA dehydrogenase n=1 Tax=Streptomonospora salina TaxID=104205 RepID=A0A841E7R0_9ACTN|nr:acyl-CoA dehydrogenase family protein [Streptomonospora salina]MBB5997339.1 alkylation response protein AidB-like acyl-CoA dehydrogenase [Streptomonospora salina]
MSENRLDLLYSEVEEELRASVRSLLEDKSPPESVLARVEDDRVADTALWKELAEIGVAGLPVPEERGGAGASLRESAVVAEELGRSVAPVPFMGSAVLATTALLECGDAAAQDVEALAGGASTGTLAVGFARMPGSGFPDTVRESGGTLHGSVGGVVDALTADLLIVPAVDEQGPGLYVVAASDAAVTPVVSLDLTRPVADVALDGAVGRRIATGADAERAVRRALVTGAALLSAEQLGVAQWALDATVDYAKTRTQFGRPIGSFQAVKHRLADLWISVSQARAVVRSAASAAADLREPGAGAAEAEEAEINASLAQAFVSATAVTAAEEALQLHGGVGFTWEHPLHLFLKRAKSDALALGTADRHRLALSGTVDLPAPTG